MNGLIHIYHGDGKGKTTAAIGLTIRALGAGRRVLFTQFLKPPTSSEHSILKRLSGIGLLSPTAHFSFFQTLSDQEKTLAKQVYSALFLQSILLCNASLYDVLVLDEIFSACNYQLVSEKLLCAFLRQKPDLLEVILTGHHPSEQILSYADYISEIRKIKHPFDKGIIARIGIEK